MSEATSSVRPIGIARALTDDTMSAAAPGGEPLIERLFQRRTFIGLGALAGGACALLLALLLPPTYVATTTILEAPRPGSGTLDQLSLGAEALGLRVAGASSNALTYPEILRSRRVLVPLLALPVLANGRAAPRPLVERLARGPDSPARTEKALVRLRKRLDITLDRRTNMLTLRVSERDPQVAAAIANAAGAQLQDVVMNALTTQSGATRRFVERQLARARDELVASEAAFRRFREQNLRFGNAPRLMVEQNRLARDLGEKEAVAAALTRQVEMAKVEEGRDVPVLNVLDPAEPPPFRSGPRRLPITAGGALIGALAGLALPGRGRAP